MKYLKEGMNVVEDVKSAKVRKIAIIFYGYGTRTVIEMEKADFDIMPDIKLTGKMHSIEYYGKKFIKSFRRKHL